MLELEPFEALAVSLATNKGVYALLIGSGLSRAAGIPSGWEITLDLVRRVGELRGVTDTPDWAAWFEGEFGKAPNYSEVVDALASTPSERRAILHSYIEPRAEEETRRPTTGHHRIARLVQRGLVRVVITTNFDRLLETALREIGIEPTIIASEDGLAGAVPLVHSQCTIIKVHGDYLDSRIRNTEAELSAYSPALDKLLDRIFDEFGLIVAGWSGEWDFALRAAIMRAPSRRYPTFWAARGAIAPMAQGIVDQRAGRVVQIADADSFFTRLGDTVEALDRSSRPHPQSTAAALALAKKYCRDDVYGLEWAEFLAHEVGRTRDFVRGPEFPGAVRPSEDSVELFLANIIATTEVVRRASLICGRWGTTTAVQTLARAIQSLVLNPESNTSYVYWRALADMGAALSFFWAVAGAVERGDYQTVVQLIRMPVRRSFEQTKEPALKALPMAVMSCGTTQLNWGEILRGARNQLAPQSAWLAALFEPETSDISILPADAAELFDQTEFLLSAEYGNERLKRMAETGAWFWCPPGRFMWARETSCAQRLEQLAGYDKNHPLLRAGLFDGDPEQVAKVAAALGDFRSRLATQYF